jgi:hypothetical protein
MTDWLGLHEKLFDADDFAKLGIRFLFDLVFAFLLIKAIYGRRHGHNEYVFTYFLFNVITFALCFLLRKVPIELGFALGLFAVFGILRYRTEPIRTRDLTYLFVVIGLAILNGVANKKVSLAELLLVNTLIVGTAAVMEFAPFMRREGSRTVTYDNMELLRSNDEEALIRDLRDRTGLNVRRIAINHIDLLRDTADITVFYPTRERRA